MKKYRTSLLVSSIILVSGCSTLDSSSAFEDVAKTVKERQNFVQVVAKDITPDTQALIGSDVIKSSLFYVGNYPKDSATRVKSSYIDMNVTSFKSYDSFDSATVNDQKVRLKDYRPQAETCTEHCTVTQWFQIPLSNDAISAFEGDKVTFTLSSNTDKNVVQFSVPKAYFDAVKQEAEYAIGQQPQTTVKAENLPLKLNGSKSQDMVQYWYGEGSIDEKKQFADWAFTQRTTVTNMIQTESKSLEMMAYWYDKANKDEKSEILAWLIRQE